ncbi:hypothetical protein R3W88_014353 [Solanum pinnatisectum]|uniref:Aminotransferase-like plant mobile domain-containing protein n=1 Tax=Solanum pinnatisectum TaxID=50273 RepID=A0AAV9KUE3_9SOLN|nr:hypothetical protein R3W88_014353 [Solanum pinnatisectum]
MEQKIKEMDSEILVPEVFVPYSTSSSEFILGTCFRDGFPSELKPFYPLEKGEKLHLHTLQPGWIDWVDRMEKVKGETWRNVGIYDAIQLSKIDIPSDDDLLYVALCFWSISSNSFHFKFGMMSPTILDISALTRIRPHSEAISTILDIHSSTFSLPKSEKNKKIYYKEFIKVNTEREDVMEDEHFAFLTITTKTLLKNNRQKSDGRRRSKNNGSLRVTMEYSKLAIALAWGRKIALAPFVLSHLYRGCRNLVTREFGTAGGPFWILQLWLQFYFLEYRPLPYDSQNCSTFGMALAQGKLKQNNFQECFKFFYSCPSITPSQFTPFSPEWLRLFFLIVRDLQYGLALGNSSFGKAGVEYYSPNQFARQFGLTQTVPLPPHQSFNASSLDRMIIFNSVNCIQEVDSRFVQLKRKFSVVPFHANPKCTSSFESWWSTYIRKTRTESTEEILDRIIAEEGTKKRRNKDKDERPCKNAKRELVLPVSKPPAQYSAQVLEKAKLEIQKLLMMPLQKLLLLENYSTLVAALPIYAESPDLSIEKARDLEELRKHLPSLLKNFQEAKKQQDEYCKTATKKFMLVTKLVKKLERHSELKYYLVRIDASISNLKAIEEQEMNLKTEISSSEARLEELGSDEFLNSKKHAADSIAAQAETSWADYKQKICF